MAAISPGSPSALRTLNRSRVLEVLAAGSDVHQAELARMTGLAPATVSNIVRELHDDGMVTTVRSGRRTSVRLVRRSGYVVGIDVGHRHIGVAVADTDGTILGEDFRQLDDPVTASNTLRRGRQILDGLFARTGVDAEDITAIGVGIPAPVDRAGFVGSPTILPGWVGAHAADLVGAELGVDAPVTVANDANLGALAEHRFGVGVGTQNMAYVKVGAGVGAGLIVDGRLLTGANGTAGEIGHNCYDEYGEVCRCGNRGCLETLVAAPQVVSLLTATHGVATLDELVHRATAGDRPSVRVLQDTGRQIGRAMADLCNLINPELIVIGGELARAHEVLLPSIEMIIARTAVPAAASDLRLSVARFEGRAQLIGAVAIAVDCVSVMFK
ncbi:ROK family transcriptional regulator [Gordonia sp. TBRC 11910]|uniref:ROK family transcriptional regulator n=1 Tax=Gordonia asplenii TaxID=2725283 RepID=A0A848KSF8_9ACTN|nr:ROK family transcriptional regulator [Gordonia asplenii]NMO01370.1 ROK family transcriptional regulator [Gordonia asplenii]